MKQRLITAAFGIPVLLVFLFFYNTILLNIMMSVIAVLAVYEVLITTKIVSSRLLFAICAAFAAGVPFFHLSHFRLLGAVLCFLFLLFLFVFLMAKHETVHLGQIGTVFMLTLFMSFGFSCIVFIRDRCQNDVGTDRGLFYILLVFIGAWITDAGGYFTGRYLGRRKLAPLISPKKTVEGAVGGLLSTIVFFALAGFAYTEYGEYIHSPVTVNYFFLLVTAVLSGVTAILGDLSASIIKRESNIKDYGNIIPGHGGILDRFDSVLFVAPMIFILMQVLPAVA